MVTPRINVVAPAKVNLCLEVLGLRDDGFHAVRTVLQAIEVLDRLEFRLDPSAEGFTMEMDPEVPGVPVGEGNLCHSAFQRFREVAGESIAGSGGLHLRLCKRIPAAAGLGGGSSDAAATLLAVNAMSGGPLARDELAEIAAGLGSDVAFFLTGGTAFAEGRGELVKPMEAGVLLWVVLAKPRDELSAREVYEAFDRRRGAEAGRTPAIDCGSASALRDALLEGKVAPVENLMGNSLERVVIDLVPAVSRLISAARELGVRAMVSGSGPTVFALAASAAKAEQVARAFEPQALETYVTRFRPRGCEVVA